MKVVVNDGLTEDEVFANEDTGDGQVDVVYLDQDVLHIDDVLL